MYQETFSERLVVERLLKIKWILSFKLSGGCDKVSVVSTAPSKVPMLGVFTMGGVG